MALEANVPYGAVRGEDYRGLLCLELANVPGGYGWVFPKGDHVNVGVGGWEREGPRLRQHLLRFCREYGIPESSLEDVRGYRLPLVQPRARLAKGRVALLGDAAGLVDPLSGDGIYEAFLSAKLATEAVLAGGTTSKPTSASCAERCPRSCPRPGARRSRSTASRGSRTPSSGRPSSGTPSCR